MKKLNSNKVKTFLQSEDDIGHGIYPFETLYSFGFAADDLVNLRDTHTGNGIFNGDGDAVPSIVGVAGLDLLDLLAETLNVDTRGCGALGRGTQGRKTAAAILQAIQ